MNYIKFLLRKIDDYSFFQLIKLEIASFFWGFFCFLPTTIGVILRALVFRLMTQRCHGFAWIQISVTFVHLDRITVGSNLGVNSFTYINGIGGIDIGNHVLIGSNVTISSGMHPIDGESPPIFSRKSIPKKISIEDDVWIGAGAVIMPGVTLRKGTVIGANSVVTRDTDEYSVMVGAPAQKIRVRKNVEL